MRILALEPYYGGSHRAVLDGLVEHTEAEWTLLTLPARKWKWRMRGAAITMAEEVRRMHAEGARFDLVFASTFVNLAEFFGMAGDAVAGTPSIVYFHENQLVYPNQHIAEWDFQFPLTNITSALAASACLFNTDWTLRTFLDEIPPFIKAFPDHQPKCLAERIAAKSAVIPPPFDPAPFDAVEPTRGARVRIVWPHRWEHDKDPETFFRVVTLLADEDLDFEVAIAGQAFAERPDVFGRAEEALGDRLVHIGEPEGRGEYAELLASSDIAVSTAVNEFFGLAMIEAAYAGCYPLVPDRLAYQDVYPAEFRYSSEDSLHARLRSLILDRPAPGAARKLAVAYTFERLIPRYETAFRAVVAGELPSIDSSAQQGSTES